jgi:hypothetical protein
MWIAEIPFEEIVLSDEIAMACGEIVEDQWFKTALAQSSYRMASDVTGSACNENHLLPTPK